MAYLVSLNDANLECIIPLLGATWALDGYAKEIKRRHTKKLKIISELG